MSDEMAPLVEALASHIDWLDAQHALARSDLERANRIARRLSDPDGCWYGRGYDDGQCWAVDVGNRDEIEKCVHLLLDRDKLANLAEVGLAGHIARWARLDAAEDGETYETSLARERVKDSHAASFTKGWCSGVSALWSKIAPHMVDNEDARQRFKRAGMLEEWMQEAVLSADPRVATLLDRLKGPNQRWYQRGRDDGEQWAVEQATRDQIEEWANKDNNQLKKDDGLAFLTSPVSRRLDNWSAHDAKQRGEEGHRQVFEMDLGPDADHTAYKRGFRDAVKELWEEASRAMN